MDTKEYFDEVERILENMTDEEFDALIERVLAKREGE